MSPKSVAWFACYGNFGTRSTPDAPHQPRQLVIASAVVGRKRRLGAFMSGSQDEVDNEVDVHRRVGRHRTDPRLAIQRAC